MNILMKKQPFFLTFLLLLLFCSCANNSSSPSENSSIESFEKPFNAAYVLKSYNLVATKPLFTSFIIVFHNDSTAEASWRPINSDVGTISASLKYQLRCEAEYERKSDQYIYSLFVDWELIDGQTQAYMPFVSGFNYWSLAIDRSSLIYKDSSWIPAVEMQDRTYAREEIAVFELKLD